MQAPGFLFCAFIVSVVVIFNGQAKADESSLNRCSYDEKAMLALTPMEFDQSSEHGWRSIADYPECVSVAADLIQVYYENNQVDEEPLRLLVLHEGQLRAESGDYSRAVPLIRQAKMDPELDRRGWNLYMKATIAFLESDKESLLAYREASANLPEPDGFSRFGVDFDGNQVEISWPPNQSVIDAFVECFDKPYATVGSNC